jgi:hypothetical protein
MSQKESNGRGRRATFTLATAIGGAAAAAVLGMGTANAVTPPPTDDGFQILFGAAGNPNLDGDATGLAQIASNVTADANLTATNAGAETALTNSADLFQATGTDHALEQLVFALDPSSFVTQATTGVDGYLAGATDAGSYLVPDDFLGYLATDLDFFLLSPTGLDPGLLGPIIDTLVGAEVGGF